jgi:hypothetical protein
MIFSATAAERAALDLDLAHRTEPASGELASLNLLK